jgi:Bacterial Ig-like domain (group 3)
MGPFLVGALGADTVTFHSTDNAGNVEITESVSFAVVSATTTSLVSSLNPSPYGQTITYTARVTVSGGTPSGTVEFFDGYGDTPFASAPVNSSGVAVLNYAGFAANTYSLTAQYEGSATQAGSTSNVLNQVVNPLSTTTGLTASPNPSAYGQTVTLTATVITSTGKIPYGTVQFFDGSAIITGVDLNSAGVATLTDTHLLMGTHSITAKFLGTLDETGSTSAAVSQVVEGNPTTTTLSTSPNPSGLAQTVTMTATVSLNGINGTPTGTVTFYNGATSIGAAGLNRSGIASLPYNLLNVGTNSITATYDGSAALAPSTSPPVSQVVNPVTTTTTLTTSPNPSNGGQTVTMAATVTASNGRTPYGTVRFLSGNTIIGSVTLNSSAQAVLNYANLLSGTDSITAAYLGDGIYPASTSPAVSQVVNAVTTATSLTSSLNPSTFGQPVTFTATVAATNGLIPTGNVQFYNGTAYIGGATLNGAGLGALNYAGLNAGTLSITAKYLGAGVYPASASSALSQVVNTATTTTALTISPNPSSSGESIEMVATVTASNGKIAYGTVQFFNGNAIITGVDLGDTGQAVLDYANLPVGTHTITAKYLGNLDYVTSTSSAVNQVVDQVQ